MNTNSSYRHLLQLQQQYYLSHATLCADARRQVLQKLHQVLMDYEEPFCKALEQDFHKSAFETFATEVGMLHGEIKWQLRHLRSNMRPRRIPCNLLNMPGRFRLHTEPVGCVLVIGAWNYPIHLSLLPAIDALAAGCTCIVKPGELAPHTSHLIAEMINSHFPAELLHVVEGGAAETEALLALPFHKIFFTGSSRVGRIVYEAAARQLTPVTLELGGKSPVIVTRHAHLPTAARRIAWGKCINAGQTCVAPDYLLVEECVAEPLMELLKQEFRAPCYAQPGEGITSIINRQHFLRLKTLIDNCSSATIRCGGECREEDLYIAPTLIGPVSWQHPLMQEEIFGPLLPVLTFKELPALLQQLSSLPKPLSAYLFSNHKKEQQAFLRHLSFGGGCINDTVMHLSNPNAPFGGIGTSGIGNYHGRYGFLCFSHQKSVLKKPLRGELRLKYPPYNAGKLKLAKRFMS